MAAEERSETPPATLTVNPDGIPASLKGHDQFLLWVWEQRQDNQGQWKWTKPPINPRTLRYGASTKSETWAPFAVALETYARESHVAGLGFALKPDGGVAFLDLDYARDPESGDIKPWAKPILRAFRHTYIEVSPTGTGIKIICLATLPGPRHVKPIGNGREKVELFDRAKYTTLTGHRLAEAAVDLAPAQAAMDRIYAELFPPIPTIVPTELPQAGPDQAGSQDDDDDRLRMAREAKKNGAAFSALFDNGDTSAHGNDHSSADQALANHIAFWFGPDRSRVDRVFRRSKLMRKKWDVKHFGDGRTYGEGTIDKALEDQREFYSPRQNFRVVAGGKSYPPHPDDGDLAATPPPPDDQRPEIDIGDKNLERISTKAWGALQQANNPPRLFRFGGLPVRVELGDGDAPPLAVALIEDRLSWELARMATWYRVNEKGQVCSAAPPPRMLKDMLAMPADRIPMPPLLSIVQTPVFAPDGSIQVEPGYHSGGRTFYAPEPGFTVPDVPAVPTVEQVEQARSLIVEDLLGDFPFLDDCERANAVGLFLEPYVRNLIKGPTPLRLIEAPMPGSGKGLLADVILRPAVGRRINIMPAANDDDEWRKRITAQLLESPPAILIDNVTGALDSGALSSALTADWWNDRRLGANNMVRVPVRCMWLATANNPTMSTELARRTVRIRLDPKVDRPWRRTGFRHDNLRGWVDERRSDLVWAGLVLGAHWVAEGRPRGGHRLGSYEDWSEIIGGVLDCAGIDGFLGNLETFYESADLEGAIWRQLVGAWADKWGEAEVGVADLFSIALTVEGIDLGKGSERSQRATFGKALSQQRDRVIGEYRIVQTRKVQRLQRWRLIQARPGGNPFEAFYAAQDPGQDEGLPDVEEEYDPWTQ